VRGADRLNDRCGWVAAARERRREAGFDLRGSGGYGEKYSGQSGGGEQR
jgi:hypothetical protein